MPSGQPPRPPLIGVTTYRQVTRWWAWERDAALVPGPYLDVVAAAGGQTLLLPPPAEGPGAPAGPVAAEPDAGPLPGGVTAAARAVVGALDGLVLIGGGDVDPAVYGHAPHPRNGGTNPGRDALELALIRAALEEDLPLLAVCRGMQVLNVALGGDLIQHLPEIVGTDGHQPRPGAFGRIRVTAVPGSATAELLGAELEVDCCHHQALATLGTGLVVTATSEDGVVEAVELPGHSFVVGVQWHPEESGDSRLFAGLVDAANRRRAESTGALSSATAAAGAPGTGRSR